MKTHAATMKSSLELHLVDLPVCFDFKGEIHAVVHVNYLGLRPQDAVPAWFDNK